MCIQIVTRPTVEALAGLFGSSRVVIFENDSRDATPDQLRNWAASWPQLTVISEQLDRERRYGRDLLRVQRLAEYRTRLQDEFRKHPTDIVLMLDLDLRGGVSLDGVCHTLAQPDWDAVGSSGLAWHAGWKKWTQYDAWAYRKLDHPDPHTPEQICELVPVRGSALVPVRSCFGGLMLYRGAAFQAGRYSGGHDIEHVCFHESLLRAGYDRIFMNPNQLVLYCPEPG